VIAVPSITRYSLRAWDAIIAASCTISRVRLSRLPWLRISSNAKLSKISMSSGSVTARVETCPGKVRHGSSVRVDWEAWFVLLSQSAVLLLAGTSSPVDLNA